MSEDTAPGTTATPPVPRPAIVTLAAGAMLLAAVLLGLPRANDYFRKPPEFVTPPPPLSSG